MDSQRRRPSSIAEQAMRKLVTNNHSQQQQPVPPQPVPVTQQQQSSESPVSPRHTVAVASSTGLPPVTLPLLTTDCSLSIDLNNLSPLPSPQATSIVSGVTPILTTLTLRDTNIREQAPLPPSLRESSYFRGSTLTNSGINSSTFLSRERDCSSPFIVNSGQYGSLIGARENSCLLSRVDSNCSPMATITHRTPSSRFLTSGIDQRIIKQSTEDCRRLLQQVKYIYLNYKYFL